MYALTLFKQVQGRYSSTILKNVLSLVHQIFLYLAAYEFNITFDWLNHMVWLNRMV